MSSNPCITWITGVEAINQQTMAAYGCRSKSINGDLDCNLGCMPALYVTQSATAVAICSLWRYTSVMPLPSWLK